MGILTVKNLSLSLDGHKILDDLSVDFWEGHIHAVVGPNGAGKSTFAYTIMGLSGYRDFEGDILFAGNSIKNLSVDQRARLGITLGWQEPARYEGLKVRDFIKAAAHFNGGKNGIVEEVLNKMGLEPPIYADRAVDKTLSGGERKKIEMASILAMRPKLVLLDEPDSGIDISALKNIFAALTYLKAMGSTVLLITHSLEVLKQADHAFLLCAGKIFDKGPVSRIRHYFEDKCLICDHKNAPEEFPAEAK
ncbi:MAG: ABC transporter ATP-binding protein [Calditrichaeota bacterium]|nr:ABC transporter ATP-binding protein [Calditrichota bacterium]